MTTILEKSASPEKKQQPAPTPHFEDEIEDIDDQFKTGIITLQLPVSGPPVPWAMENTTGDATTTSWQGDQPPNSPKYPR